MLKSRPVVIAVWDGVVADSTIRDTTELTGKEPANKTTKRTQAPNASRIQSGTWERKMHLFGKLEVIFMAQVQELAVWLADSNLQPISANYSNGNLARQWAQTESRALVFKIRCAYLNQDQEK